MALLNMQFDQTEIVEAQKDDFAPIPAGTYTAEINRSEIKDTKRGDGNYLSLGLKILEGEYAGRVIFQNINLRNPNQIAMQIGRKQMAQLFHACGKLGVQDSSELHGIPMQIKVAISVDKSGMYDPSNEVKKFAPIANSRPTFGNQAPMAQQPVQQQTQPQMPPQQQAPMQSQSDLPPWQRG